MAIERDTICLLRECDAGVRMGVDSINEVYDQVRDEHFRSRLAECRREHEQLKGEIRAHLDRFGDEGKDPNPMVKGMSWLKTNVMLGMDKSDATIADLMTDGCGMGVKSLSRYLNQYEAADEYSKDAAKRLIHLEEQLIADIREYL